MLGVMFAHILCEKIIKKHVKMVIL